MQDLMQYVIPVAGLALLAAGWMGMQLIAHRMKVKNHIDNGGCCGACGNKASCTAAADGPGK